MDERSSLVDVSIRYARALDERDWELLAGVFTPDVEVSYSSGNHMQGRDAVAAQVRAALEGCGPPNTSWVTTSLNSTEITHGRVATFGPSLQERPMVAGPDTPMSCSQSIATSW
jgi:hypothetical protein